MHKKIFNIFTDGGSRGNPGPSAIGVYMTDDIGNVVAEIGKTIGITTNNVAEYSAVIEAYDYLLSHEDVHADISDIHFYLDSRLVCSQIKREFKIKNENLRTLLQIVWEKEKLLGKPVSYTHIPREKNKGADRMVNRALDNLL